MGWRIASNTEMPKTFVKPMATMAVMSLIIQRYTFMIPRAPIQARTIIYTTSLFTLT